MSFRCLLIVSLSKEDYGKIILFRCFPTVEKRCQTLYGEKYASVPNASLFVSSLLVSLGLSTDSNQFVDGRDDACKSMQLPVFELSISNKEIWPIIAINQGLCLVCCVPFIENYNGIKRKNLLEIAPISVGFSLLLGILNYAGPLILSDNKQIKFAELESYITLVMPFGTPSDVEFSYAPYSHKLHLPKYQKKQPAWKAVDYKGKNQISLKIREYVRSMQSKQHGLDSEIFGQIYVKADLEGAVNEVTISFLFSNANSLLLDSVAIHPCVNIHGGPTSTTSGMPKRVHFTPPLHEFILLQYCMAGPKEPPIHGILKMLGENSVELSIQLKLNESVKNNFEFCDVIIVFFNRGPITNIEFNSNHGSVKLLEDKYTLKWSIGSKFPRDLEAITTAKLEFCEGPVLAKSDPFCINENCYAQVNFKQSNTTLTGLNIDPKSVGPESSKPKIIIERSVQSSEYRLWNNYGDLPFPTQLINKSQKLFK